MAEKKAVVSSKPADEGKTIAIISYITWIGWIIAFIMNTEKKNDFARFHLRQSLIIMLGSLLAWIPFVGWIWGVFLFVLWILGLIAAINGQKKEIPVLGSLAQQWFKGL
jgi:uncharacterized membrane protein